MKKVLVVNDKADMGASYYLPFEFVGPRIDDKTIIRTNPEDISLVVFTGGSDVSPSLYGEPEGRFTHTNPNRDKEEGEIFSLALENKIPMFGICRGLQFLTVMFGGKLIQNVNGHHCKHMMRTKEGKVFEVSSSHHQMVLPKEDHEILAWASPTMSKIYMNGHNKNALNPKAEIEAVRFGRAACGVQYHPEIMDEKSLGFRYAQYLTQRYLLSKELIPTS